MKNYHENDINRYNWYRLFLCLILILLPLTFGCVKPIEKSEEPAKEVQPKLVRTLVVTEGENTELRTFSVFAKEGEMAKLSFRVAGQLQVFNVKIGQRVKKDEVIAQLDQRDFILAVERIKKAIVEAEAALKAMKTGARAEDVAALESQVAAALSQQENAKKQLQRMENLKADGSVSDVQYDLAKTTYDTTRSAHDSLVKQLEKAKAGARVEEIEMAEAKIARLKVDLTLANNALGDTELKAPFDGIVAEKYFDNHEMIAPGIALVAFNGTQTMEATLSVPQDIVRRKEAIRKIECEFESSNTRYPATIKELGQSVQTGNMAYLMTIVVQIPEEDLGKKILSGMVGKAYIELSETQRSLVLPTFALIPDENAKANSESTTGNTAVWLVRKEDMTVERRSVETSALSENGVVVKSGLKAGDIVVMAGARYLKDGQKIRLEDAAQ